MSLTLTVGSLTNKGFSSVLVDLDGKSQLVFCANHFSTAAVENCNAVFTEINLVLAGLDRATQETIYDLYNEAYELLEAGISKRHESTVEQKLTSILEEIVGRVKRHRIEQFVAHPGNIALPPTLMDVFEENSKNLPEWTYLRQDYVDLVVFVMACRLFIPIWGLFLYVRRHSIVNVNRDASAYRLIQESDISTWPGHVRLTKYINTNLDNQPVDMSLLARGIGTSDLMSNVLSQTLLRKLVLLPLQYVSAASTNLVSAVYNNVLNGVQRMSARVGMMNAKRPPADYGGDGDTARAAIEMYTTAQHVPDSVMVRIEMFVQNHDVFRTRLSDKITKEMFDLCMDEISKHDHEGIEEFQIDIAFMLTSHIFGQGARRGMSPKATLDVLGMAQAYLWAIGYLEIAVLLTAKRVSVADCSDVAPLSISRPKITAEQRATLDAIYPYWQQKQRKQTGADRSNLAVDAIEELVKVAANDDWEIRCPNKLAEVFDRRRKGQLFALSPAIRQIMADLIIEVKGPKNPH